MQLYKWYDIQEENDFHTGTLEEGKAWLLDFWQWNPYTEEDLEQMEEEGEVYSEEDHHAEINNVETYQELNEMLGGIGWAIEEEPSYIWYDLLEEDKEEREQYNGTLYDAKEFLTDHWTENNEGQFSKEELEEMFININKSTLSELCDRLGGIGWTIEEEEEEENK